jgi:hypothetical protein
VWPTPKTLLVDGRDARLETFPAFNDNGNGNGNNDDDASVFIASDVKIVSPSASHRCGQ